jgi:CSLREA domain-containing protein
VKKSKLLGIFVIAMFAVLGIVFLAPHKALAATLTVDSVADDSDSSAGDGNCDNGSGDCTLRAAIEEANALSGADTINFSIAGGGVHTFAPASAYPIISESLFIDGTSQAGASCGTLVPTTLPATNTPHTLLIEIRGDNIVSGNGQIFYFQGAGADNSHVQGLVINNALDSNQGIYVDGASNFTANCNYMGTNVAGTIVENSGNPGSGLTLNNSNDSSISNNLLSGWNSGIGSFNSESVSIDHNLVGTNVSGTAALPNYTGISVSSGGTQGTLYQNVVSGNTNVGIALGYNTRVENSYIGIDIAGNPLGNGNDGIMADQDVTNSIIGEASTHNVISANGGSGIHYVRRNNCSSTVTNTTIIGNYIGTNASGSIMSGYGNHKSGISIHENHESCGGSVYKHKIGGDAAGEANLIAGNTEDGVRVYSVPWEQCDDGEGGFFRCNGTDVFSASVLQNKIYQNGGMNINLASDSDDDGIADQDLEKNAQNMFEIDYPAGYANNYLNSPTVNSASYISNQLTVNYSYQAQTVSGANSLELNPDDRVGYRLDFYANGGKDHIGSFIVNGSEANANHTFTTSLPLTSSTPISATATILWRVINHSDDQCTAERTGNGPPYEMTGGCD